MYNLAPVDTKDKVSPGIITGGTIMPTSGTGIISIVAELIGFPGHPSFGLKLYR